MNISQIRVINRGLGGDDIYGLPTLNKEPISDIQVEFVKNDLIKLGILNGYKTFTKEGANLARRIQEYKNAKKYIEMKPMVLAPIDENRTIIMKCIKGDYTFVTVSSDQSTGLEDV